MKSVGAGRWGCVGGLAWALLSVACNDAPARGSIGPDGGVIASADGALTLVIWPGALAKWEEFTIRPSDLPPPSFGQAYLVQPPALLAVDAEIIYRADLPMDPDLARIGAIYAGDFMKGSGRWRPLELEPGGLDDAAGILRAHDDEIAIYYTLLGGEPIGGTSGTGPDTGSEESTGDVGPPLSYAADIQPIWDANCMGSGNVVCHAAGNGVLVELNEGSYDRLVNQRGLLNGDRTFVVPGDPEASLIYVKIAGVPPERPGGAMPPAPAEPLSDEQIAAVRSWIRQDAPP